MKLFIIALIFFILPGGRGETKLLKVKDRGATKLQTKEDLKLKGDFHIWWYFTQRGQRGKLTLVDFDSGNWTRHPPDQFKNKLGLNETTGALTLRSLSAGDSGIYYGNIVEENNQGSTFEYNITVENPVRTSVTAGPSGNTTSDPPQVQRNHIAAITAGSIAGIAVLATVYLVKAKMDKKKKEAQSSAPSSDSAHLSQELEQQGETHSSQV